MNFIASLTGAVVNRALVLSLGLIALPLLAQPTGGQVVAGSATISTGTGALTVTQTSARAIIHWQDFSLAAGELARFVQPDATSATLNRVVSGLPSSLAGTLQANGRVYLINPNGILVGAQARIDTGGFLASTLDVANREFLAGGDLLFTGGSTAAIRNLGAINALGGDVFLIARQVENSGAITAANGNAGLAAGSEILLTTGGDERLFVLATSVAGTVVNAGTITAASAELKAAGGNAYALAINNTGIVRATGSAVRNGQVWLVASGDGTAINSGTLDASGAGAGQTGGLVRVLGEKVGLFGGRIDVSGDAGGGTVLIGGDLRGANPAVRNASATYLSADSTITADAITSGNGGQVVLWANDSTRAYGGITARGGAQGGDGGLIETSGHYLDVAGIGIDAGSTQGTAGTWLLDPLNVTITGTSANGSFSAPGATDTWTPSSTGSTILNTDINSRLDAGTNVTIQTNGNGGGENGTITVSAAITRSTPGALTLLTLTPNPGAGGTITIGAAISGSAGAPLSVKLDGVDTVAVAAAITTFGGDFTSTGTTFTNAAGTITTAGGIIDINQTAAVTIAAPLVSGGGNIVIAGGGAFSDTSTINAGTGTVTLQGSADTVAIGIGSTTGTFNITQTNLANITTTGGLIIGRSTGTAAISIADTEAVDFGAKITTIRQASGNTTINTNTVTGSGNLTFLAGNGIFTANSAVSATGGATLNITAADVVLASTLNSGAALTRITASAGRTLGLGGTAGNLTLSNVELGRITAGGVILNTTDLTGDVTVNGINAGGSINSGPVTINAGGTVTFATVASTFNKGVTVSANDGIAVDANVTATNGNLVLDGDANSTATPGDGIVFTGTRTLSAATDFGVSQDPAQGSITLRNGAAGTNGGIASAALTLTAFNGITISDDLTATAGNFSATVNADGQVPFFTGSFTLASGKTLATATSGNIDLKAVDVILDGSLNSVGTATVTASYNINAGLGSSVATGGLNLSDAELGRITATGLTIAADTRGLNVATLGGVTAANSDQFGTLTLLTPGTIHFENTAVVGNSLSASADGGIVFIALANLSTSTAVNADPDLSLTGNNLAFNTDVTITAGGTGTLGLSTTGTLTSNGNLTLESGDNLALNYALSSPGFLILNADKNNDGTGTLTVANAVTVSTTGAAHTLGITAADLTLTGTGALNSGVSATTITASAGRSIGLGATVIAGGLNLAGAKLQQITATGLTLTSGGNITVDGITEPNSNNITGTTTLTGSGGASTVTFANTASTFNALTVNSTTTIANNATLTLDTGNLALNAGTTITQTGALEIGAGTANLTGTTITLAHASNTLGAITVNSGAGDVSIREDAAISIAGITRTSGSLTLNAATDLTQTGAISIAGGAANLTAANITLGSANVLGAVTINAGTGNIALTEADAISIAGITHTGTLGLTASGAITDSGALVVSGTTTLVAGAANDITLDNANDFSTIVVTSGKDVTLNDLNALALGNVTAAGSLLVTATGNLTLNSGATLAASGAVTNPLVLVAGGNFINSSGAAALNAGTGRWLVYSTSPAGSTENGLTAAAGSTSPRLYNRTFAGNAPASIVAGNHLVYSSQPTLTVTADNQTRVYGDANPTFTAAVTAGFLTDDGVTDTLTSAALTGSAAPTSLATAASPVSGSPFTITAAAGTLASGAGYGFTFANGLLAITVRPVTVTADPGQTKVYGSADPAPFTFTTTSLGGGAALSGALTRAAGETVAGGTYAITQGTVTDANNPNYSLTYAGSTFAITPATLTYTANTVSRLYGVSNPSFGGTVTGFVNGETQLGATTGTLAFGSPATAASNVSSIFLTYAIDGSGLTANNGNYLFVQAAGNASALTINPATLTYTADSANRLYGAGNPAFSGAVTGFANGETLLGATTGTLAFGSTANATSNTGSHAINGSGLTANNGNYLFAQAAGNATALTINPATLTYTANAASRLFGASDPAFSGTISGFANGEAQGTATTGTLAFATTATVASVAGLYPLNGSGLTANNGNYLFVQAAGNATAFTIGAQTQTPLTITADNKSKLYGAALPTFTASFAGFLNGDTASSVTGLQFSTTATMSSNTGTFTITPFGATAPSAYLIGYVPGTLTINPATLTYTATPANRLFGASDPAFSGTVTGFISGEAQATATTGTMGFATTATGSSVAGSYPLNGSGLTANNGNYLFVQAAGNATAFTIGTLTQTPLTITADDKSKLYGAALPTFTASFAGFLNGDTAASVTGLQFSTTATISSNVGTFAITPFGATAPSSYVVGYVPGLLTINPAALTILADNKSRAFAAANPAFTASFTGFVNGDTASAVVTGLQLSTTATVSSPVGSYAITAAGATAANYVLTYLPGTLTVGRNLLTITADSKTGTYGAALPAFTASFAGFVNGDTSSVVTGLQFSTTATVSSNTGTYTLTPFGASAANYSLAYISSTLTISPASLTLTATDAEREFGAANPAFAATFAGFVNGDTAAVVSGLTFSTPATVASAVGDYSIAPLGATAANYTLAFVNGTLRVVTPSVTVGTVPEPVVTIDQLPAITPEFAVILQGDRRVLIPVDPAGVATASVDERLTLTLGEATGLTGFEHDTAASRGANTAGFGSFEFVASSGGGRPDPAQLNEPGLFRESTVSMGGFNVVYHESLAEAHEQSGSNTALGSSYREFADSDNAQVNIVRAKRDRKPADPAAGRNPPGAL